MLRLWVEDGPKYRTLSEPNVGLAVAGDDSLYVVTIPTPDTVSLPELVDIVKAAAGRGREGHLDKVDQTPATITVSNLGMFAVDSFDAIIDPDQNAILATASVQDRVVAVDGTPTVVPQLTVNLSCDHRSVDGAQGAQFLRSLRGYFETDPAGPAA
jgi:pyruvate dehydrogenase E2 component (dihydrolipoamide acetyltransferase)